jgi:molybdopterin-containing oxidoreductase family membrane subunit
MSEGVIRDIGERPIYPENTTFHHVTHSVSRVTEDKAPRGWWLLFIPSLLLAGVLFAAITYLLTTGVGSWGNNHPVGWAWDITNFVWWIGIGHAGTLISAILYLFRQKWRTSINRFAEAMTIFAVMQAGLSRRCTPGDPGSTTTCSRSRTRWRSGRTSRAR